MAVEWRETIELVCGLLESSGVMLGLDQLIDEAGGARAGEDAGDSSRSLKASVVLSGIKV